MNTITATTIITVNTGTPMLKGRSNAGARLLLLSMCTIAAQLAPPPANAIEASREVTIAAELKGADRGELREPHSR